MSRIQISEFTEKVIRSIRQIPEGRVATYKQIAELAGKPQGSRGVSWILHSCSVTYKLPWHRVLNSKGCISFDRTSHNFRKQKSLLQKEGVEVDAQGSLILTRFQWKKKAPSSSKPRGTPRMFSSTKAK